MEFIEGTPITKFVQRENIGLRGRLQLFLKVCSAIDLAHRHHIIHRDIKPGNVLVNENCEPRLLDFGIAKLLGIDPDDEQVTITAERRLTPLYAAPEQNAGQAATIASDVYSLGALLYELLTNKPPPGSSNGNSLENDPSKHLTEPLPSHVATDPQTKHQLRGQLDQIVAKTIRRVGHSDIPAWLSYPKISNDISTSERLAPNVPPEGLPGTVGRLRLPAWAQSCWQRLCYFHCEANLPGRSQLKQVRPTRLWRTRSRCYRSTISA